MAEPAGGPPRLYYLPGMYKDPYSSPLSGEDFECKKESREGREKNDKLGVSKGRIMMSNNWFHG